jgi:hypothetical protein
MPKAKSKTKPALANSLPKIGSAWNDGVYAGLSLENEKPVALVLLPGDLDEAPWADAVSWAEKQGGVLPSRIDQLVLFQNLKGKFEAKLYWSGTPYAGDESYAWYQYFGYGYQNCHHKYYKLRARAVRRVAI